MQEQEQARARVMLFDEDGPASGWLGGTWVTLPWGMDDFCYSVVLFDEDDPASGVLGATYVWLEGVTESDSPPQRLVLSDVAGAEAAIMKELCGKFKVCVGCGAVWEDDGPVYGDYVGGGSPECNHFVLASSDGETWRRVASSEQVIYQLEQRHGVVVPA